MPAAHTDSAEVPPGGVARTTTDSVNGDCRHDLSQNRSSVPCSGPTHRSDIDLIRQVGGTRSSGAVNPTTDGSPLNAKMIAMAA